MCNTGLVRIPKKNAITQKYNQEGFKKFLFFESLWLNDKNWQKLTFKNLLI